MAVEEVLQSGSEKLDHILSHACMWLLQRHILLAGYLLILLASVAGSRYGEFDDGIPLMNARQIAHGLRPYGDFFSFYPPFGFWLTQGAFFVFGETVQAQRILSVALLVLLAVLVGKYTGKLFPDADPMRPALALVFAISCGMLVQYPIWPGYAISLAAVLVYTTAGESEAPSMARLLAAGALAGLATWTRINLGAYALLAIGFTSLVWNLERRRYKGLVREILGIGFAYALVSLICLLPFKGLLSEMFYDSVIFPNQLMTTLGFLTLPIQSTLLLYALCLPPVWVAYFGIGPGRSRRLAMTLMWALAALLLALVQRQVPTAARNLFAFQWLAFAWIRFRVAVLSRLETVLLGFFIGLLHYYLSRASESHVRPILPVLILLCGSWWLSGRVSRDVSWGVLAGCGLLLLATVGYDPWTVRQGAGILLKGWSRSLDDGSRLDKPAWRGVYGDPDEIEAVNLIRRETAPSEPVFVGVTDHSTAAYSSVRTNWLVNRPPGVYHYIFASNLTSDEKVQDRMIRDLEQNRVRWSILVDLPPLEEFKDHGPPPGSKKLDEYLTKNFVNVATFGRYAVIRRH